MADILAGAGAAEPSSKRRRVLTGAVGGLPPEVASALREDVLHWAAAGGLMIGAAGPFDHAPCSLLPYPFPASLFAQARALAKPFNTLVDRVSRDTEWLHDTVRGVVEHDEFTGRLLALSEAVVEEGATQPLQLGIYRSDYMVHQPGEEDAPRLLQVELNTISVSFVSLAAKMTRCHRHALTRAGLAGEKAERAALRRVPALAAALDDGDRLPPNTAETEAAAALAAAHAEYMRGAYGADAPARVKPPLPPVVVLMIVQPDERNVVDQRGIEHALWATHKIRTVRVSLAEVRRRATLDGPNRVLRLDGGSGFEVAVVYFRAGYTPNDYPSEGEWEARRTLERSHAVKCPSVAQQLAGTKKVQQALALPDALTRFVAPERAAELRSCFARLDGLDVDGGSAVSEAVERACEAPDMYVLKPQREGGGNNLFGAELRDALRSMGAAERAAYILMERIVPPTHPASLMRGGELDGGECACELGVFGVFLGDGQRTLLNEEAGHLLRVKLDGVDEGGVCAGFACLSSPALYP